MMHELVEVLMDMRKEVRCADKYAAEAKKHREEFPELSMVYSRIAVEKLAHADMLCKQAEQMARKEHMEELMHSDMHTSMQPQ